MQTRNIDGVTNDPEQKKGKSIRALFVASFLLVGVGGLTACESEEESFESDPVESVEEASPSQEEASPPQDEERVEPEDKMTSEGGGKPAGEGEKRVTPDEVNDQ